jgi:hypothetical protein
MAMNQSPSDSSGTGTPGGRLFATDGVVTGAVELGWPHAVARRLTVIPITARIARERVPPRFVMRCAQTTPRPTNRPNWQ